MAQINSDEWRDVLVRGLPILMSRLVQQQCFHRLPSNRSFGMYNRRPCDILRRIYPKLSGFCPSGGRDARFRQVCIQEENHTLFTLQTVCTELLADTAFITHTHAIVGSERDHVYYTVYV